jgi:hypothetical protein
MSNTTNVPPPVFQPTGLVIPQESAILAGVQEDQNAAFGGNLNPALNTPQGQLASSTTAIIANANTVFATFVNQVDPDTATGFMQDAIARIYFLTRNPAVPTAVSLQCVGAFGTVIPVGAQAQDTSGNVYVCQQAGTIPTGGSITLPFANAVPGPIPCPANTVTIIYQSIPGWDTVNNSSAGVAGENVESPAAFEYRREQSVGINAQGSLPAIYANLFDVDDVLDVFVTQNNTGSVISSAINGNPNATSYPVAARSIYAAVVGGNSVAVATALWQAANLGPSYPPTFSGTGSQAAGVVTISATASGYIDVGMTLAGAGVEAGSVVTSFGTYTVAAGTGTVNVSTSGTVSSGAVTGQQVGSAGATLVVEQIQDTSGYQSPIPTYPVSFITPAATPVFFAVSIQNSTSLPSDIVTLVQQAIVNSFTGADGSLRARIGSIILASKFYAPVSLIGPEVSILSILIGFTNIGDATNTSVQMGIDQAPTITSANIGVTLV